MKSTRSSTLVTGDAAKLEAFKASKQAKKDAERLRLAEEFPLLFGKDKPTNKTININNRSSLHTPNKKQSISSDAMNVASDENNQNLVNLKSASSSSNVKKAKTPTTKTGSSNVTGRAQKSATKAAKSSVSTPVRPKSNVEDDIATNNHLLDTPHAQTIGSPMIIKTIKPMVSAEVTTNTENPRLTMQEMEINVAAVKSKLQGVKEQVQDVLDFLLNGQELDLTTYHRLSNKSFSKASLRRVSSLLTKQRNSLTVDGKNNILRNSLNANESNNEIQPVISEESFVQEATDETKLLITEEDCPLDRGEILEVMRSVIAGVVRPEDLEEVESTSTTTTTTTATATATNTNTITTTVTTEEAQIPIQQETLVETEEEMRTESDVVNTVNEVNEMEVVVTSTVAESEETIIPVVIAVEAPLSAQGTPAATREGILEDTNIISKEERRVTWHNNTHKKSSQVQGRRASMQMTSPTTSSPNKKRLSSSRYSMISMSCEEQHTIDAITGSIQSSRPAKQRRTVQFPRQGYLQDVMKKSLLVVNVIDEITYNNAHTHPNSRFSMDDFVNPTDLTTDLITESEKASEEKTTLHGKNNTHVKYMIDVQQLTPTYEMETVEGECAYAFKMITLKRYSELLTFSRQLEAISSSIRPLPTKSDLQNKLKEELSSKDAVENHQEENPVDDKPTSSENSLLNYLLSKITRDDLTAYYRKTIHEWVKHVFTLQSVETDEFREDIIKFLTK